jgi:hypothetical protein
VAFIGDENASRAPALLTEGNRRMAPHLFFSKKNPHDTLLDRAHEVSERARKMPPGVERERLIKQARESEIQANIQSWLNSPGLQSPKGLER